MSLETLLLSGLESFRNPYTLEIARSITDLGSVPLLAVYVVTLYIVGKRLSSYMLAIGGGMTAILVYLIKALIARPRPDIAVQQVVTHSFPSGHTATAFLAAVILGRHFPRERHWFLFLAGSVGFTRLFLGVHYPSDVIVGGLIGYGIGRILLRHDAYLKEKGEQLGERLGIELT